MADKDTPKRICITGTIGSGKSVVSRICRLKGYHVYDCDYEARRIMDASDRIRYLLRERLGEEAVGADGRINRPFVADMIFGDDGHRLWLNALVHEAVREDFECFALSHPGQTVFVETAIPAASHISSMVDLIWVVSAPDDVAIGRACMRDGASREHVMARAASQLSEIESLPRFMIRDIDNGGLSPLLPRIDSLLTEIRRQESDGADMPTPQPDN